MTSFVASNPVSTDSPSMHSDSAKSAQRQTAPTLNVQEAPTLTDIDRETAIQRCREAMEAAYKHFEDNDCIASHTRAVELQNILAKLIAGRKTKEQS